MSDILPTPARPKQRFIEALEPSRAWILGLVVEPDGSLSGPRLAPPLSWPECDCPDDCALDHEND
jgi:hypothetical protein